MRYIAFLIACLLSSPVLCQSSGNFTNGPPPLSAQQLNSAFQRKADYPYAGPIGGVVITGPAAVGLVPIGTGATTAVWAPLPGSFSGFANPTGTIGLTAVNGSATTAMRSDAAPALSQAITPVWTGLHIFGAGAEFPASLGSTAISALETADTSWNILGTPVMIVANACSSGACQSAIVGYQFNNANASTTALPAGVVGYGKTTNNGNIVFGVYGLGELYATGGGVATNEMTVRNNCGSPDTNLPPNEGVGTVTCVTNGLQITAGGNNNSSIGIIITSEGGSSEQFNTGLYFGSGGCMQYCIYGGAGSFIIPPTGAASFSHSQNSQFLITATNSNTGGSAVAGFSAISQSGYLEMLAADGYGNLVQDINGALYVDSIGSSGTIILRTGASPTAALTLSASQNATIAGTLNIGSIPTSAGSGGLYVCVDTSGNTYKKSSCP